jgi:hypothetical protein
MEGSTDQHHLRHRQALPPKALSQIPAMTEFFIHKIVGLEM